MKFALFTLVLLTGCATLPTVPVRTSIPGHFGLTNRSSTDAQLIVSSSPAGPIVPGNNARTFDLDVPTSIDINVNIGNGYGNVSTSGNTNQVSIVVAVQNKSTGQITRSTTCQAGPRVMTNVTYTYSVDKSGNVAEWLDCQSTQ